MQLGFEPSLKLELYFALLTRICSQPSNKAIQFINFNVAAMPRILGTLPKICPMSNSMFPEIFVTAQHSKLLNFAIYEHLNALNSFTVN